MCFSQWYVPVLFFLFFYFYFFLPGGPVEEPLKPFCSFFSLRRLSSSIVFQWGSLRQTLDLSKTTNEKVPWRRPSIYRKHPLQELSFTVTFFYRKHPLQELSFFLQEASFTETILYGNFQFQDLSFIGSFLLQEPYFWGIYFSNYSWAAIIFTLDHLVRVSLEHLVLARNVCPDIFKYFHIFSDIFD